MQALSTQFDGKTVAVMGLGRSGAASARALTAAGAEILAWDDQEETRALAAEQGLTLVDVKGDVIQHVFCSERLHHMLKLHRDVLGLAHMAVSGKRKKMHLISNTSARMISRDDRTTLLVAASPTPFAPSSVV